MEWLWIPITVAAALSQNIRTAVQRHLTGVLSTNGAAFTRFAYGMPFAAAYLIVLTAGFGIALPRLNAVFLGWVALAGVTQILATSLLLTVLGYRNFAVGIAYSKTEVVQAAIFGLVFLGDRVTAMGAFAIALGTVGVMLMSLQRSEARLRALLLGWTEGPALIGIASGALFGISATGFRAASLSLGHENFVMAAGYTLVWGSLFQTAAMGAYLAWREKGELRRVARAWRWAVLAGLSGIVGSACWFTAMTIQLVAYVRTLGLIELVFTFAISRLVFKERQSPAEIAGCVLLVLGIALVLNAR